MRSFVERRTDTYYEKIETLPEPKDDRYEMFRPVRDRVTRIGENHTGFGNLISNKHYVKRYLEKDFRCVLDQGLLDQNEVIPDSDFYDRQICVNPFSMRYFDISPADEVRRTCENKDRHQLEFRHNRYFRISTNDPVIHKMYRRCQNSGGRIEFFFYLASIMELSENTTNEGQPAVHLVGMNEFLNDDEGLFYGDFFDRHMDEFLNDAAHLKLTDHGYDTDLLLDVFRYAFQPSRNILVPMADDPRSYREVLAGLDQDTVRKILKISKKGRGIYASDETKRKALIRVRDLIDSAFPLSREKALTLATRSFVRSIDRSDTTFLPKNLIQTLRIVLDSNDNLPIVDDPAFITPSKVSTSQFVKIVRRLDELDLEASAWASVLFSLSKRNSFIRSGTVEQWYCLMEDFLVNERNDEKASNFVRVVTDVVLHIDTTLPTVAEWRSGLSQPLAAGLDGAFTYSMTISADALEKERRIGQDLRDFRKAVI